MKQVWLIFAMLALVGCTSTPKTIVQGPTTARPVATAPMAGGSGAIFQAGSTGLFEDRVARRVGDILTISIQEKLSASTKSDTKANRTGSMSASANPFSIPYAPGVVDKLGQLSIKTSSGNNHEGKGEATATNTFTGTITVTVTEVLPNGNLAVAGEKQIAIHNEHEFLRFSGVVNPADIKVGNTVSSTKVADARIEQRANGALSAVQEPGWLQRFFLTVLPF
ncbi:flagellar L-ring protein precursor FlgH [Chitinivorax tropicus]|uniref:Flagellar L-ring protein n=1 Tax=Chitinivorax tropicus TaxID=714531 RepID=A0A840MNT1_9PROT|nr:flagellar basal body L-ring protein FlgH [Chitinivorax tropicus]MBB5018739.1 flagellar L-ring protein precursor FlgH [Chitinivorax tropicus]